MRKIREDARAMLPSQAYWYCFSDLEIPKDLLSPRSKSKMAGKISSLIRTREAEASRTLPPRSKGDLRVVIPANFARRLGIGPGDSLTIALEHDKLTIRKKTTR